MRIALFFAGILAMVAELLVVFVVPLQVQNFATRNVELGVFWALVINLSNNARTPIGLCLFMFCLSFWTTLLVLVKPAKFTA